MDFSTVHNVQEKQVFEAVAEVASHHPELRKAPDLLADVACIALNRVQARYIRNDLDFAFYQTETELLENDRQIAAAVEYALGMVLQRRTMDTR